MRLWSVNEEVGVEEAPRPKKKPLIPADYVVVTTEPSRWATAVALVVVLAVAITVVFVFWWLLIANSNAFPSNESCYTPEGELRDLPGCYER